MRTGINLRLTALSLLSAAFFSARAQSTTIPAAPSKLLEYDKIVNAMAVVKARNISVPPEWAIMQRQLIDVMEQGAPYYLKRFTRPDGTIYGKGPYDDVYEMFYNWPELYAISGNGFLYETAVKEYNAITRSNTAYSNDSIDYFHQLYKEYPRNDDFFHISEGLTAFYNLALGDPSLPENIQRARRFAGLYLNEDPEAQNFDEKHHIIKSIFTGSKGPLTSSDATYNLRYGHASLYPIIPNLEPGWPDAPERKKQIQDLYDQMVTRTDVPVNLAATGLMANAYLYTGEEKYKQWVLNYVDAWMKRITDNGGLLPDNIGQTGKVGEYRNGQWWGGLYGWYGRYGLMMMFSQLSVAMESAYLLSGDPKYLDLLRSQITSLMQRGKTTKEGQLLVPFRYKKEGWFSYRPMMIQDLAHLWHASMDKGDWEKIEVLMKGNKYHPLWDEGIWGTNTLNEGDNKVWEPAEPFDWSKEISNGDRTFGSAEHARLMYYAGKNPDWPVESLKADYKEVVRRMNFMQNDPRDVSKINGDDLYPNNPVITKALIQTTMGTPQTIYNGGLLRATLRYFDAEKQEPGLPKDVAALVEGLEADRTVVNLVNLNVIESRRVILQAGAFGEHTFTTFSYEQEKEDEGSNPKKGAVKVDVNNPHFVVELPPGASIKLDIGMRRFVNKPSYAFPWHRGKVAIK
ncbi:hypothetical protein [Dyadobacter sp. 32]|uniref:hypothetical protein n=1 Tax=Dyadobacter sp. 32 TaxID=538966 RepID=UPI0039C720DB